MSVPAGLSSEAHPWVFSSSASPLTKARCFRVGQAIEDAAGRFTVTERWWANSKKAGGK